MALALNKIILANATTNITNLPVRKCGLKACKHKRTLLMDVQRQVVSVQEVHSTFRAVGVWIDRYASNHQSTESCLRAIGFTVKTCTWSDNVLLLTNKVLSQQCPSTKSANTKSRNFCTVFNSSRNVLKDVLTSWVY